MRFDFLQEKLDERAKNGNLRSLPDNKELLDFVSNDYLGLARNHELAQKISDRLGEERVANGGTGSRLLSGNHKYFGELEQMLCDILESESALVFNSGYAANQALVSSVAQKGDTILYDQLSHVCLKEGAWLNRAETTSFRHNDMEDLRQRLARATGNVFVLTETVFSMDGDIALMEDLVSLCEEFGAYLIVDEAHSTGVYGKNGAGMLVRQELASRVFARVYTFGKGMGAHGACVAGPKVLTDYLINFGRPFIYTTSLPPHSIIALIEAFKYLAENQSLQTELHNRIDYFRLLWRKSLSETAIQPVMIGSNEQARKVASALQESGYDVRPILSPTVKRGTERLRISLHVHNSEEEIKGLIAQMHKLI